MDVDARGSVGLSSLSGCCQFATVRCWAPAEAEVSDLRRLAIVDFQGEGGEAAQASLERRLSDSGLYSLTDDSILNSVQHAACFQSSCTQSLLVRARERGIDGVIVAEVQEYRCDDELQNKSDTVANSRALGQSSGQEGSSPFRKPDNLERDAAVAISFQLVDSRTGETLVERDSRHRYSGASDSSGTELPSRREVLRELTEMCLDDFVETLAPHQVEARMKLARGDWYGRDLFLLRKGNRAAAKGNWDVARDTWERIVDRNPDCDAALFNLSLDAAHRQQYSRAEELAMHAIRLRHTDQYAEGLAAIREYRSGYNAVQQQRNSRVLQASADMR